MSVQITTAMVEQYKANTIHLYQQKGSRLRPFVDMEDVVGKNAFVERVGKVAAVDAVSRHDDTPQIDTPHSRRRLSLVTSRYADLIDNADKVRLLISPESEYAIAGANAMGRRVDDHVISAATGNAFSGAAGATTVALPSGQKVAAASAGLTLAKLRSGKLILDANEVDMEDRIVACSAKQLNNDLLADSTLTSADFNTVKALVDGQVNTFLGFTFVITERLGTDSNGDRQVLMFHKRAIRLGVGSEITAKISERNDKNHSIQVFFEMDMGATRVEDEGVVEVACVEV